MQRPESTACVLRPEIVNLDMDTALAMVRACHEVDIALLIETEKRRKEATEWIKVCQK